MCQNVWDTGKHSEQCLTPVFSVSYFPWKTWNNLWHLYLDVSDHEFFCERFKCHICAHAHLKLIWVYCCLRVVQNGYLYEHFLLLLQSLGYVKLFDYFWIEQTFISKTTSSILQITQGHSGGLCSGWTMSSVVYGLEPEPPFDLDLQ